VLTGLRSLIPKQLIDEDMSARPRSRRRYRSLIKPSSKRDFRRNIKTQSERTFALITITETSDHHRLE
jgi:hypothetical protein